MQVALPLVIDPWLSHSNENTLTNFPSCRLLRAYGLDLFIN